MGSLISIKVMISLIFMLVTFSLIFPESSGQKISSWSSLESGFGGRHLLQIKNDLEFSKEEDDTVRTDPLNNFKKYRGGYNITSKNYWSSTIFTGVAGYAIGVVWLLGGMAYVAFLVTNKLYYSKTNPKQNLNKIPNSTLHFHQWAILLALFFTLLSIVGSGIVMGGSIRFEREAKEVVNIIMETANVASNTIHNTSSSIKLIISNLESSSSSSSSSSSNAYHTSSFLTSTSLNLDLHAANIHFQAHNNTTLIHNALNLVYILTMVIISLNLVSVIALSVSGILRFQRAFYLFIFLCWFLTVFCWLFFGLYFFLNNLSSDTCTALEKFQENPNNNSLSSILPCEQLLTAKSVLTDVSSEIYDLVNEVNTHIAVSYPDIALVCNPFSAPPYYEYQPQNCAPNTIGIGEIPKVLKLLTCSEEGKGGCENAQFMSNSDYITVEAYTNSIQAFLNAYPSMESLVQCQTVKSAFSTILAQHCSPLQALAHMVWAGLALLSVFMVLSVFLWTAQARFWQKNRLSDESVQPSSSTRKAMEMTDNSVLERT